MLNTGVGPTGSSRTFFDAGARCEMSRQLSTVRVRCRVNECEPHRGDNRLTMDAGQLTIAERSPEGTTSGFLAHGDNPDVHLRSRGMRIRENSGGAPSGRQPIDNGRWTIDNRREESRRDDLSLFSPRRQPGRPSEEPWDEDARELRRSPIGATTD